MENYQGKDLVATRELLEAHPAAKWGFVIYRCAYVNDNEWAQFMDYLNIRTRLNLESTGDEDLFERIDWQVQEDRERFEDARPRILREHFIKEILPTREKLSTSDHDSFIAVYQRQLSRILSKAPSADEFDAWGTGFVTLISVDEDEGRMLAGVSYLVPRIYTLLDGCGWDNVYPGECEVACP